MTEDNTLHTVMDEKEYIPGKNEMIDKSISQANRQVFCIGCNRRFDALMDDLTRESPLTTVACRDCKEKLKDYTFKQANR